MKTFEHDCVRHISLLLCELDLNYANICVLLLMWLCECVVECIYGACWNACDVLLLNGGSPVGEGEKKGSI